MNSSKGKQGNLGGLSTPQPTNSAYNTMSVSAVRTIIDYLEHPKTIGEFHGSTLDGMLEVDFSSDKLEQMIHALSPSELSKLMGKVTVVCAQWSALKVAPDNDIGTIARYQEANLIIGTWVSDMTVGSSKHEKRSAKSSREGEESQ